mgnify:CR=1 FL=1
MKNPSRRMIVVTGWALAVSASCAVAQDWPQWRGPNRDAKATGFTAPKSWPKELTRQWKVTVGQADGSPALVAEFRRTIAAVQNQLGGRKVESIVLFGSGQQHAALAVARQRERIGLVQTDPDRRPVGRFAHHRQQALDA